MFLCEKLKQFFKMRKVLIGFLLFQIALHMANASLPQYQDRANVAVLDRNGKQFRGEMILPYVNSVSVDVLNGNAKQTFKSSDITEIRAWKKGNPERTAIRLVYSPSYEYKSIKDELPDLVKQAKWMISLLELENIKVYMVSQQYDPSDYYSNSPEGLTEKLPPNHWIYVIREGEKYPTRISLSPNSGMGSNQHFRAVSLKYFQDCPELCERITEGQITNQQIIDAVIFYNNRKENH